VSESTTKRSADALPRLGVWYDGADGTRRRVMSLRTSIRGHWLVDYETGHRPHFRGRCQLADWRLWVLPEVSA
jgi:hypothetical protein